MKQDRTVKLTLATLALGSTLAAASANAAPTLAGWASMPAQTTSVGPTSGQFAGPNALLPIPNAQPVQGISAVLDGPRKDTYYVMSDNGFGAQNNSADALLRVDALIPNFKTWDRGAVVGAGTVTPADARKGKPLATFDADSFLSLRDPDHRLGFRIQAELDRYYGVATNPPVDPTIKAGRLLTGADFDVEAVRQDKRGNLWFGEEFGPFLVKTDKTGKVLRSEIPLPNIKPAGSIAIGDFVRSPQNPFLGTGTANLGSSRGFEGMAINASRNKLYTLLEGTVTGDPADSLRIDEFDIKSERYTGVQFLYRLDALGTNIGDMTAINDRQFLVIERNGNTATTAGAPYKHIFLIDTGNVDANGYVTKTDLVDLMNIADPHDLNGDGSAVFTFPYVTIESVLIIDSKTLFVINDNNFPGGGGRSTAPDISEFLLIQLDSPLQVKQHAKVCDEDERCDE